MTGNDGQARDAGVVIALFAASVCLVAYVYRGLELTYHGGEAASPVAKLLPHPDVLTYALLLSALALTAGALVVGAQVKA
jgi:hypothetical protein